MTKVATVLAVALAATACQDDDPRWRITVAWDDDVLSGEPVTLDVRAVAGPSVVERSVAAESGMPVEIDFGPLPKGPYRGQIVASFPTGPEIFFPLNVSVQGPTETVATLTWRTPLDAAITLGSPTFPNPDGVWPQEVPASVRPSGQLRFALGIQGQLLPTRSLSLSPAGTCTYSDTGGDADCLIELPAAIDDPFTVVVTATDLATRSTTTTFTLPVDDQAPTLSSPLTRIAVPPGTPAEFRVSINEPVRVTSVRLAPEGADSGISLPPTATRFFDVALPTIGREEGAYDLVFDVADRAGNTATITVAEIEVDATPPVLDPLVTVRARRASLQTSYRDLFVFPTAAGPADIRTIRVVGADGFDKTLRWREDRGAWTALLSEDALNLPWALTPIDAAGNVGAPIPVETLEVEVHPDALGARTIRACADARTSFFCVGRTFEGSGLRDMGDDRVFELRSAPVARATGASLPRSFSLPEKWTPLPDGSGAYLSGVDIPAVWRPRDRVAYNVLGLTVRDAVVASFPPLHGVVAFGGSDFDGQPLSGTALIKPLDVFNQTYEVEVVDGSLAPDARTDGAMAYYPGLGAVVLFGGTDGTTLLSDTWLFDGAQWTRFQGPEPPARTATKLVYLPRLGQLVLFGGQGQDGLLGDTWTFDEGGWTPVDGDGPAARRDAMVAYEPTRGQLIMAAGTGEGGPLDDTWLFDGQWTTAAFAREAPEGAGHEGLYFAGDDRLLMAVTGTTALYTLEADGWTPFPEPPRVFGSGAAIATGDGRAWTFGGSVGGAITNELWAWDGRWTRTSTTTGPTPRWLSVLAKRSNDDALLLFGGLRGDRSVSDELWLYRDGVWTAPPRTAPWPSPRYRGHAIAGHGGVYIAGGSVSGGASIRELWFYGESGFREIPNLPGTVDLSIRPAFDEDRNVLAFCSVRCNRLYWLGADGEWTTVVIASALPERASVGIYFDPFQRELYRQVFTLDRLDRFSNDDADWISVASAEASSASRLFFDTVARRQLRIAAGVAGNVTTIDVDRGLRPRLHFAATIPESEIADQQPSAYVEAAAGATAADGTAGVLVRIWDARNARWVTVGSSDGRAENIETFRVPFDPGDLRRRQLDIALEPLSTDSSNEPRARVVVDKLSVVFVYDVR